MGSGGTSMGFDSYFLPTGCEERLRGTYVKVYTL